MNHEHSERIELPVLPLRDVVVYPYMVIPLFVGRERSIRCLEAAMGCDKKIILVAQKEASKDDPGIDDLFSVGTAASVLQMLKLPDGTIKVLVEGLERVRVIELIDNSDHFVAQAEYIASPEIEDKQQKVLMRAATSQFESYTKLNKKIPPEVLTSLQSISDAARLADTIASHVPLKLAHKQSILEMFDIAQRFEELISTMESEIDLLQVENRIRNRVKKQMEKSQREYYLNEKMKAIQKELGESEGEKNEFEILKNRLISAKMPKEALSKTETELRKLKTMPSLSAEATVVRSYIDWMIQVPWSTRSRVRRNLNQAEKILNEDHYGLEEVKDRIIEYLAVQSRSSNKVKGPILCFVGPPGVGKTSLGKSIAKAIGRKYTRIALGGLRDEAEIRGHRRTYIGSMPGKVIQKMVKVGVKNPLFLLDEVDKISLDSRGDPASALLEVLDPEQNVSFNDHYLEVDYDLSEVMFLATSNSMNIPLPLLDRMEVIRLPGYTEEEKTSIAKNHLLPKQTLRNMLSDREIGIEDAVITRIIRHYTREAGVRGLERELSKLCRKVVKSIATGEKNGKVSIDQENLKDYLGVQRFDYGRAEDESSVGRVTGLAWTEVGGDLLSIEVVNIPGKGKLIHTGSLGKVMKESIQTALTVARSHINASLFADRDIHVHIPEGATPKDGPSAGIALCTAIISCLTGKPVASSVAMTGEITLLGKVLPIGGLKEKLLAAHRGNIKIVLIPKDNERDLAIIPENVLINLEICPVSNIKEVLNMALGSTCD